MKISLKAMLAPERRKDILLRIIPVGAILLLSILLLSYSLYFLHVFEISKSVTSYFPWRWGDHYSARSSVTKLFDLGLGVSLFFLLVSSLGLFYFVRSLGKGNHPSSTSTKTPIDMKIEANQSSRKKATREKILRIKRGRHEEGLLPYLHSRFGRISRIAAVFLLGICVVMLGISYKYPNAIVELDSIIAFVAALILLFKDQKHTVQLRVVNGIIESSHEFMKSAGLRDVLGKSDNYTYVPLGESISDVVLRCANKEAKTVGMISEVNESAVLDLVPLGRGLAVMFEREISIERPTLEDLFSSLPSIMASKMNLAAEALVTGNREGLEVTLLQPTLIEQCNKSHGGSDTIYCEVCSMIATVACHISRRESTVEGCLRDDELDTSTIKIRFGNEYVQQKEGDEDDKNHDS